MQNSGSSENSPPSEQQNQTQTREPDNLVTSLRADGSNAPSSFWRSFNSKKKQNTRTLILTIILFAASVALWFDQKSDWEEIKAIGELVVISRESPTIWHQVNDQPAGPEYDYLSSFAEFLGVDLRFEMRNSNREVLEAINQGHGHIGAAGIIFFEPLEDQGYIFGPEFQEVDVLAVCRRNHIKRPKDIAELSQLKLAVVADSIYESLLTELQLEHPDLSWESTEDSSVDELLQLVWRKKVDCTIANSSEVNITRRFYPELQPAFAVAQDQSLVWNISPQWTTLSGAIEQWLWSSRNDGSLLLLHDRHYKNEPFDYVDMRTFVRRIKSRLPRVESLFKQAAEEFEVPWTLLAAQSYQESHWNRRAKSPTGVRGIMMLTLTTAKEMGVKSRLNAKQSITGGAKYLSQLESRIPDSVEGDDRLWFALAAYNVGMGHLHDARQLAVELNLNPDSWIDLKSVLPLLEQKKYYQHLKFGRARGTEPVTYVRQIRNYRNILRAQFARTRGTHDEG